MEHLPWARILSSVNSFNSNTSLVMVVGLAPPFYRGKLRLREEICPRSKHHCLSYNSNPGSLAPQVLFLTTLLFIKQKISPGTVLKVEHHVKNKALLLLWE